MPGDDRTPYGIDLLWIPLGVGGSGWVRFNGRVYERLKAMAGRRDPVDLYHTALLVRIPGGEYVVETTWPCPDADTAARGVVLVGPVFSSLLSFTRVFRYAVRCWKNGILPDAAEAFGGPQAVSRDRHQAEALLEAAGSVPLLTWGRDEAGTGEMWNSNSVISWLLARSGIQMDEVRPPGNGRGPGWDAGVVLARSE